MPDTIESKYAKNTPGAVYVGPVMIGGANRGEVLANPSFFGEDYRFHAIIALPESAKHQASIAQGHGPNPNAAIAAALKGGREYAQTYLDEINALTAMVERGEVRS